MRILKIACLSIFLGSVLNVYVEAAPPNSRGSGREEIALRDDDSDTYKKSYYRNDWDYQTNWEYQPQAYFSGNTNNFTYPSGQYMQDYSDPNDQLDQNYNYYYYQNYTGPRNPPRNPSTRNLRAAPIQEQSYPYPGTNEGARYRTDYYSSNNAGRYRKGSWDYQQNWYNNRDAFLRGDNQIDYYQVQPDQGYYDYSSKSYRGY